MSRPDPESNPGPKPSIEQQLELDRICAGFEERWQQHPDDPPQLLTWLDKLPSSLTRLLFRELLAIDIEFRRNNKKDVDSEQLQTLYPGYAADIEYVLQKIADREQGRPDDATTVRTLPERLAAQQSGHLRDFIKSLEQAPLSELPPQIANWTQQQLARARDLEQTLLHSQSSLVGIPSLSKQRSQFEQLGDFRIIREIGRGGMGTVFEAEQLSLRRRVALKVLWFGGQQDADSIQRFEREATTIANLHHTNIVPIFAVGEQDGVNYYAMQLIEGQSLDALMKAKKTCNQHEVADWAVQAADALVHAHDRGVIHRDIKPSNLMLDSSGRLWLTDFGLAKREQDQTMSLAGVMLGTPRYMSPEQASTNLNSVDHRSDIYSLGATLYELLAGRPVFDGTSPFALIRQILTQEPSAIDLVRPGISRDLATVVMKCLRKDPRERYATARELLADLRCVQEGRPILARRASVFEVAGKWLKRYQQSVRTAFLATAALILVSLGVTLTWLTIRQYYTTQLKLETASTATTVDFIGERKQIARPSVALPTTEPLTVRSEPLTMRFHGKSTPSVDYRWLAQPQMIEKFEIELHQQDWDYPRQPRIDYQMVGVEPRRMIVSWTNDRLYVDVPGTWRDPPQIQEPFAGFELKALSDQTKVRWVTSLGSDLDGDGFDEIMVALAQQAALHVVSRKGVLLWVQTFADAEAELPDPQSPIEARKHRGEILQMPELVPDQDGDGKQDLLLTIGQNPHDPASDGTRASRSVVLVSANGKLLWRHDLDAARFQLPASAAIASPLQWQLEDSYSSGTMNLSSFVIRSGRRLRDLVRRSLSQAPHIEAPQAQWLFDSGRNCVLIRTGTQLQLLDLTNGNTVSQPQDTGVVSAVPFVSRDLNGDGTKEIMLIESLPPLPKPFPGAAMNSIPQTRLVVWSLQKQAALWETTIDSVPPAVQSNGQGQRWPAIVQSTDLGKSWLILPWRVPKNVGYQGHSMPWSELAMIDAGTGKVEWTCQVPNMDCYTDQISLLPDLNRDSLPEVAIASLWGEPFQWVVECRSGATGELIWLQHEAIDESRFDEVANLSYLASTGRLQMTLTNVEGKQAAFQFAPHNGEVLQTLQDFQRLEFLDFDGDAVDDWCITNSERISGETRKTLQIVKGTSNDRWRRLGLPVQMGSDFDMDVATDLLTVADEGVQAISSHSGEILWQYQPAVTWAECRVSTWESESNRLQKAGQQPDSYGIAPREAWDVDGDGTLDLVLQAVTIEGGRSHAAIVVLSGRTGKPLWNSQAKSRHHEAMPPLTICDLDRNNRLDILSFEWLLVSELKESGAGALISNRPQSISLTRWEVGGEKSHWTIPIEGPSDDSVINRWNWEADLPSFPRPTFIEIDQDGVTDLAFVLESQKADAAPQLRIGAVSGKDGRVVWTKPLGINSYHQGTIADSERYIAADVDGDGQNELAFLEFVSRKAADGTFERFARLQVWEAATGNQKWSFEHPVADDFIVTSNTRLVKPLAGRGEAGKHWIAMPLRNREKRDVVVVVDSEGHLLDMHELGRETSYYEEGFRVWKFDRDGDKQDELFFDDGGLVSFRVGMELELDQKYPVDAQPVDVNICLVEINDQQRQLVVTNEQDYIAQGFDLQTAKPLWRVVGPQAQKQRNFEHPGIQVISKFWLGESPSTFQAPWIAFNGYRGETTLQMAAPIRSDNQTLEALDNSQMPLVTATGMKDFRQARPLPWDIPNSPFSVFHSTSLFITFLGFVLLASGLLIWLPFCVWRSMRIGWISHLGALLLMTLIVAVNLLFLGQTFTVPFLLERPDWHDKLGVGFQYAPLWATLYAVPQWIWHGAWRRCLVWTLIVLMISAAFGVFGLYFDRQETPFAPGEHYAASWSPALFVFGFFAASWLGAIVWGAGKLLKGVTVVLERLLGQSKLVRTLKAWQPVSGKTAPESRLFRRPRYVRTLYLWGVVGFGLWVLLCPNWRGVSYLPEGTLSQLDFREGAVENGSFGLSEEGLGHYLWDPPISHGGLASTVRWPWQFVSNQYHVEFDFQPMFLRLMGALMAWGGMLFIVGAFLQNERRDLGWLWVGLMTLLWVMALLIFLALQMFSMGYLPGALGLEIMFVSAWVVGFAGSCWLGRLKDDSATGVNLAKTNENVPDKSRSLDRKNRYLVDAILFVLGFALAFGVGLWLGGILPDFLDPEWQPGMGPGLPGPRLSTMRVIGWIYFGLALISGLAFSWWRSVRGIGIGMLIGWMVWAIFCWIYK